MIFNHSIINSMVPITCFMFRIRFLHIKYHKYPKNIQFHKWSLPRKYGSQGKVLILKCGTGFSDLKTKEEQV